MSPLLEWKITPKFNQLGLSSSGMIGDKTPLLSLTTTVIICCRYLPIYQQYLVMCLIFHIIFLEDTCFFFFSFSHFCELFLHVALVLPNSACHDCLGKFLWFHAFKLILGVPLFPYYMKEIAVRISGKVAFLILILMKRYAFNSCSAVKMFQYLKNEIHVSW